MARRGGTSTPPRPRSHAERSAGTRAQLIEGAIAALRERGFARATTAAIAARAGVTTGALHHHFATKEELLFAVLGQLSAEISAQLGDPFALSDAAPGAASRAVRRLWTVYGGGRYRAVWEITIGFSGRPRLRAAMTRERERATAALIERATRGLALTAAERAPLATLLRHALIAIRGLFLDTYLALGPRHFEEQLDVLARALDARLGEIFAARRQPARAA
jgi:AcrR family transcriptional regulator